MRGKGVECEVYQCEEGRGWSMRVYQLPVEGGR